MKRFILCVVLFFSSIHTSSAFTPTSDGMYAVFNVSYFDPAKQENVTDEFTIQLLYGFAPVTCANFLGLAEGTIDWYNFDTQLVETNKPFFNGLKFHRVVANFVIQTGSPNALGNDGPGWRIPDEAHPDLNHVGGGVVSMANNGANTGGSQFFISMAQFKETEAQLFALNGKHTVFGFIVPEPDDKGGQQRGHRVTQAIGRTPLNGSTPVREAVINSVTILRQGVEANAFDPSQYWPGPVFKRGTITVKNDLEDLDGDPDTDPVRRLTANWFRKKDSIYFFEDSNDLDTWTITPFPRIIREDQDEKDFLAADVSSDRRHFYRLLEAELPALPDMEGKQITINFDPIEVDEDRVRYVPKTLTVDFYEAYEGGWTLKRSDSDALNPIGNIIRYQKFPIGNRDQLYLAPDFSSTLQAYLTYDDAARDSGSAYIYYPNGRPEGSTVTGTFTIGEGNARVEPVNKDGLQLILTLVTTPASGEAVTTTFTIDFWDNFTLEGFEEVYEAGYKIVRSNTQFIQNGRIIYDWLEIGDKIQLLLDFDSIGDMQVQLSPSATSGTAEVYFRSSDSIDTATYSTGVGNPRPESISQEGNKLILTLDLTGTSTDPLTSTINIDFYDNFEGGYETTRTDTEANQFGALTDYQWFQTSGETRVDLIYDNIPPMQVYLTPTPNSTGTTEGTAKVNFPQNGQVLEATYKFTVDGGNPRPETLDKKGVQLTLEYQNESIATITHDIYEDLAGTYEIKRLDSEAIPTGKIANYSWFERLDGTELVFIDYDRLPDTQIILTYNTGRTGGQAEVLLLDSGTVNTIPFSIGTARVPLQSINQAGKKLIVDLIPNTSTIDKIEVNFRTTTTGDWKRFYPEITEPQTGVVDDYEWFKRSNYDQVNVLYDFLLDTQIFLKYDSASSTSGSATVYFITSGNIEKGTFTIGTADP